MLTLRPIVPTLIILLAGLIVSFAALPLQNTEWAEGFRTGVSERGEVSEAEGVAGNAGGEEEGEPSGGVLIVIGPLIKVAILMGIGGLLTALGLWTIHIARGSGKARSEVKGSE